MANVSKKAKQYSLTLDEMITQYARILYKKDMASKKQY